MVPKVIAFAPQQTSQSCFLACLQSFLAELGIIKSQREIFEHTPGWFGNHPQEWGGFAAVNFPAVASAWNLEATPIEVIAVEVAANESLFVVYLNQQGNVHWVRVLFTKGETVFLMDPGWEHCPRKVGIEEFLSWNKAAYLVRRK